MNETDATEAKPQRRPRRIRVIDATPSPEGFARMKVVMERALTGYREDIDYIENFDVSALRWTGQRGILSRRERELIEQGLDFVRGQILDSIQSLEEGIAEVSN